MKTIELNQIRILNSSSSNVLPIERALALSYESVAIIVFPSAILSAQICDSARQKSAVYCLLFNSHYYLQNFVVHLI